MLLYDSEQDAPRPSDSANILDEGAAKKWPQSPHSTGYTLPSLKDSWSHDKSATRTMTSRPPSHSSSSPTITPNSAPDNACNSIRILQSSLTSASPGAIATVPAALAYDCITSVPFNSSAAVALLDSLRPYISWQTTLQYVCLPVKNPPIEYAEKVQASYDFWTEWDRIYATATSNTYNNEYEFGFDLYLASVKVHDGHFVVFPDSVANTFSWFRDTALVSISPDGTSIPEVFVYQDVLSAVVGKASFNPSPLTYIDGRNSTEYLLEWSQYGSLQDPDALWNNVFCSLPQVSLGWTGTRQGTFSGGGRGRAIYPGPSTTLTFGNGTSKTYENHAIVIPSFENITSGADIYQRFFIPLAGESNPAEEIATQSSISLSSTSTATTSIPAPGYPVPVVRQAANLNSGYFLDGEDYDDVAVLSVASFVSFVGEVSNEISFQAVNTYFLERAVAENKTKLILDLSANGGGTILQAYDLFKQLFPHIEPYGASRFKAHEAFDLIGREVGYYAGLVNRSLDLNQTADEIVSSTFNYQTNVDVNGQNFESWYQLYGPELLGPNSDPYTHIIRWNLSDILIPSNSRGINISGYGDRSNITEQKFKPENIIIITDGYCASACAIFSEFMRQQAGVKMINLGGRPNTVITQAVGGVKGTYSLSFEHIRSFVQVPFNHVLLHSREFYNHTVLGAYNDVWHYRTSGVGVNGRDGFRQGDPSNVPLQFKYEPADCRIYYTPEMAVDMTAAWKTVADTAFNRIDHCTAGGIGRDEFEKRSMKKGTKHSARSELRNEEYQVALKLVADSRASGTPSGDCLMIS